MGVEEFVLRGHPVVVEEGGVVLALVVPHLGALREVSHLRLPRRRVEVLGRRRHEGSPHLLGLLAAVGAREVDAAAVGEEDGVELAVGALAATDHRTQNDIRDRVRRARAVRGRAGRRRAGAQAGCCKIDSPLFVGFGVRDCRIEAKF